MITKPMLAGKIEDTAKLQYPVIASPKIDGIRCLKLDGRVLARSLKPIPNEFIRKTLEKILPDGIDGEIIVGKNFQEVSSGVMSEDGQPAFVFHAFDLVTEGLCTPYRLRLMDLGHVCHDLNHPCVEMVPTLEIDDEEWLLEYEEECLTQGYEGVMVRDPSGPYKCGRSTTKEGWLLKLKRFTDGEAVIIGFAEQMHNENEATTSELGRTKRSHAKEGMVPANTLGTFKVRDCKTGVCFEIGTGVGLTAELRQEVWNHRGMYLNKVVKYRFQAHGTKNKPRSPIWLGFRDERDL